MSMRVDSEGIVDLVRRVQHVIAVWLDAVFIGWESKPVSFSKGGG